MKPFPYREVFNAVESGLIERGSKHDTAAIRMKLDRFKHFSERHLSDDEYFGILVMVTFYSGFKSATVKSREDVIRKHFPNWKVVAAYTKANVRKIAADAGMIRNKRKILACVKNAKTFGALVERHGSIRNYVNSYAPKDSLENLLLLKEALEASFEYLGGITVYHFMTDIGLPVLKPDRVMSRIFVRLGLLENRRQLLKAVLQGRKFAEATGHPIRYIDIVFVKYGQVSSKDYGIDQGICLEKPRCSECGIQAHCLYWANAS